MSALATPAPITTTASRAPGPRLLALAGGIGAGAAGFWLLLSNPISAAAAGDGVTPMLITRSTLLQGIALLAVFASAALIPAALRLGEAVGGAAGRVAAAAGCATAVLLAAYIGSFAAGAMTATMLLDSPGAGVGEATLVIANVTELARYGPSLALTAAVVTARGRLSRATWIPAAALAVLLIVPVTAWLAAIIVPAWLGIAAATIRANTSP
jgi:hypothetical protein